MKTSLLTILFSFLFLFNALSQEESVDDSFVVSGKVISSETMKGVSFAHVKVDDTYWGIICDSLGFFRLRVKPNQKLRISALGFKEQIVEVETPSIEDEVFQEVMMERESFLLEEVAVYSLGTWSEFKENFLKAKVPEKEDIASSFNFGNLKLEQAEAASLNRGGFGFNLGEAANLIKSIGKNRRMRNGKEQLTDWQLRILQSKYNKEIVAELTHESGAKLEKLMEFISSRQNFTHQTTEFYIGVRVKQLYKEFLETNPKLEENYTLSDSVGTVTNHLRP